MVILDKRVYWLGLMLIMGNQGNDAQAMQRTPLCSLVSRVSQSIRASRLLLPCVHPRSLLTKADLRYTSLIPALSHFSPLHGAVFYETGAAQRLYHMEEKYATVQLMHELFEIKNEQLVATQQSLLPAFHVNALLLAQIMYYAHHKQLDTSSIRTRLIENWLSVAQEVPHGASVPSIESLLKVIKDTFTESTDGSYMPWTAHRILGAFLYAKSMTKRELAEYINTIKSMSEGSLVDPQAGASLLVLDSLAHTTFTHNEVIFNAAPVLEHLLPDEYERLVMTALIKPARLQKVKQPEIGSYVFTKRRETILNNIINILCFNALNNCFDGKLLPSTLTVHPDVLSYFKSYQEYKHSVNESPVRDRFMQVVASIPGAMYHEGELTQAPENLIKGLNYLLGTNAQTFADLSVQLSHESRSVSIEHLTSSKFSAGIIKFLVDGYKPAYFVLHIPDSLDAQLDNMSFPFLLNGQPFSLFHDNVFKPGYIVALMRKGFQGCIKSSTVAHLQNRIEQSLMNPELGTCPALIRHSLMSADVYNNRLDNTLLMALVQKIIKEAPPADIATLLLPVLYTIAYLHTQSPLWLECYCYPLMECLKTIPVEYCWQSEDDFAHLPPILQFPLLAVVASRLLPDTHKAASLIARHRAIVSQGLAWPEFIDYSIWQGIPQGECALFQAFLMMGIDINTLKHPPLIRAVGCGCQRCFELAWQAGADINKRNINGYTAVMSAVKNKRNDMLMRLLDTGADVTIRSSYSSPLIAACEHDDVELMRLLLERGADSNDWDTAWDRSVLMRAKSTHALTVLLDAGADSNARDKNGLTALMIMNKLALKQVLLARGADVNTVDNEGNTALMRAVSNSVYEEMKLLLEAGADIQVTNKEGKTALMIATQRADDAQLRKRYGDRLQQSKELLLKAHSKDVKQLSVM